MRPSRYPLDRNGNEERRGQKSGLERQREGGERKEGVGLPLAVGTPSFRSGWLPQNHRRPAASDGTGCTSERATTATGRSHHERAMSGQSVDVVWDPQTQNNSLEGWDYSIELAYLKSLKGSSSENSK